jgi:transcriptional regulator with XRE-family HTH domain
MKKPMTPTEIKRALAKAGYSQADIAAGCEVSNSLVNRVVKGTATSYRVQIYIAGKIGLPVDEVWSINKNPSKPGPKSFSQIK